MKCEDMIFEPYILKTTHRMHTITDKHLLLRRITIRKNNIVLKIRICDYTIANIVKHLWHLAAIFSMSLTSPGFLHVRIS